MASILTVSDKFHILLSGTIADGVRIKAVESNVLAQRGHGDSQLANGESAQINQLVRTHNPTWGEGVLGVPICFCDDAIVVG